MAGLTTPGMTSYLPSPKAYAGLPKTTFKSTLPGFNGHDYADPQYGPFTSEAHTFQVGIPHKVSGSFQYKVPTAKVKGPGGSKPKSTPPAGKGDTGGGTTSVTNGTFDPSSFSDPNLAKALIALANGTGFDPKLASSMAAGITNQGVNAYKSLQHQDISDANNQALAILAASRAGASLISNLTSNIPQENTNIANDLAGVAGGFTGQLGTSATAAAKDIAARVAANGGTFNGVTPSGMNLNTLGTGEQNALYAAQSALPAGNFLSQAVQANASKGALPAEFLGSGQQDAMLQTAAGHNAADKLLPQIAGLLAKEPNLASQLLTSLAGASAASNKAKLADYLGLAAVEKNGTTAANDAAKIAQGNVKEGDLQNYRNAMISAREFSNITSRYKATHSTTGQLTKSQITGLAKSIALGSPKVVTVNGQPQTTYAQGETPAKNIDQAVSEMMARVPGIDASTAASLVASFNPAWMNQLVTRANQARTWGS